MKRRHYTIPGVGKVKAVVCYWNGRCVGNGMMIYGKVNLYHVFIFDDIGDSAFKFTFTFLIQ
jgi:hypothetical protein